MHELLQLLFCIHRAKILNKDFRYSQPIRARYVKTYLELLLDKILCHLQFLQHMTLIHLPEHFSILSYHLVFPDDPEIFFGHRFRNSKKYFFPGSPHAIVLILSTINYMIYLISYYLWARLSTITIINYQTKFILNISYRLGAQPQPKNPVD